MYVGRLVSCALFFLTMITANKLLAVTCEDVFAEKNNGVSVGAELEKTREMLDLDIKRTFIKSTMRKLIKDAEEDFFVLQVKYGDKHRDIFDQFRDRMDSVTEEAKAILSVKEMKSSPTAGILEFNSLPKSNKFFFKLIDQLLKDNFKSKFSDEIYFSKKNKKSNDQNKILQRLNEIDRKLNISYVSALLALDVTANYHKIARGYNLDLTTLSSLQEKIEREMWNRADELEQQQLDRERKRRIEKSAKEHKERMNEILNTPFDGTGIEI